MNKKIYTTLLKLLLLFIGSNLILKAESTETIKFITSGNCIVCEVRIEEAVKKLPGIVSVFWDATLKVTTVTFDGTKTNVFEIMKKIAAAGHDTEWYKGDDYAYNTQLKGTCCEYPRTIDYSLVKIGYLSLMDQWVSVNTENQNIINIYSATDLLKYNITGYENTPLSMNIYSMLGQKVYSNTDINMSGEIDISSFLNGAYIVILTNKNKTIYQQKIIKY